MTPAPRVLSLRVLGLALRHPIAFFSREIPVYLRWRLDRHRRDRTAARRAAAVNKYTPKAALGVEIAPWCRPVVPKRAGYHSVSLDLFDTPTLIERAMAAGHKDDLPQFEPVDFVGDACDLAELIGPVHGEGRLAYIVSSHNFEHLPDPLRFLQGATRLLAEGGVLTMVLPDKRATFDYYRPLSTVGDMIEAFFAGRRQPTAAQVFAQLSLHCCQVRNGVATIGFQLDDDPGLLRPMNTLQAAFADWQAGRLQPDPPYQDTHCWVFTPASFALILFDLNTLGLCDLRLAEPPVAHDGEIIVHLRKPPPNEPKLNQWASYDQRRDLLRQMMRELARNAVGHRWRISGGR